MSDIGLIRPDSSTDPNKLDSLIMELISTEKYYVKCLEMIVNGYITELRKRKKLPPDLDNSKLQLIFRNIDSIYSWHKETILPALEEVSNPHDNFHNVTELCRIFQNEKNCLEVYINYCGNFPLSEFLVTKYYNFFDSIRQVLNHELCLSDFLIMPIQRVAKYKQLLNEIFKCLIKEGRFEDTKDISLASDALTSVLNSADKMMLTKNLENFPRSITDQGKLILCDTFSCAQAIDRRDSFYHEKYRRQCLFLFENCIVICDIEENKMKTFLYRHHIRLFQMDFQNFSSFSSCSSFCNRSKWKFLLIDKKDNKKFVCKAEHFETHEEWVQNIENLIQEHRNFAQSLANPAAESS